MERQDKRSYKCEYRTPPENKSKKRNIFAILLIVVGAVILSANFGLIPESVKHIIISWPMLLIAIGVSNMVCKGSVKSGLILITIGSFFLAYRIFDMPIKFSMIWPAILVIIGLILLFVKTRPKHDHHGYFTSETSGNYFDEVAIFGGGKKVITSENLQGGKVTNIFGGSEIDLLQADMEGDHCVIDVTMMFGGSKIIVPANWDVHIEVSAIFGAFEDKRTNFVKEVDGEKKTLIVKGTVIFGGGEVQSYKS